MTNIVANMLQQTEIKLLLKFSLDFFDVFIFYFSITALLYLVSLSNRMAVAQVVSSLYVQVFLGKMLNPKLPLMHL